MSVIGVGTWQFAGEWGKSFSQREVDQILNRARETGINLLDTAECYGDHLAESLLGNALHANRDDWIVATKFGHHFHGFVRREDRWSPRDVVQQLEASLQALKTDYVDLYQFHSGSDDVFQQDDLWMMLDRQVKAGKVRYLGISLRFPYSQLQLQAAHRMVNMSVIQVRYNRLEHAAEDDVLPFCRAYDFGVIARVPLASGFLTGKYLPGAVFEANDVRSTYPSDDVQEKLVSVEELRRTEVPEGKTMTQWALSWCLRHPEVTCIIPGCKSVDQVEENIQAAEDECVAQNHPLAWQS